MANIIQKICITNNYTIMYNRKCPRNPLYNIVIQIFYKCRVGILFLFYDTAMFIMYSWECNKMIKN